MPIQGRVDLDLRDVIDGFEDMRGAAKNLMPVWQRLLPLFRSDVKSNAKSRSDDEGKAWPKHSSATIEKRRSLRRKGRKVPRGILGKLRFGFAFDRDRTQIQARSKVDRFRTGTVGAEIHQDGGGRTPKRTFAYVSDRMIDVALDEIVEHVTGAF
jgi:hypothetical protein